MQDAGLINDARALHYLFLIPITFLYWDHLMTFGDEVRFLWRKPKTPSTYCFFLNRYLACFSDVAVAIFVFSTVPPSWCTTFNLIRQIVLLLNEITICALLTLRIYALYDRDRRVWIYMLGAGIVLIAVSCWAISGERGIPQPDVVGCHIANSFKNGVHLAVPWESLFIYDVMIFVTLFYKSLRRRSEFGMTWTNIPILTLLLRDGAMYFVIMAVVNLANILTFYLADPLLRGCLSTFASCMSVTMMSRLMLNLHAVESRGIFSVTARLDHSSSSPSNGESRVELDTLWTRDLERSAFADVGSMGNALESSHAHVHASTGA